MAIPRNRISKDPDQHVLVLIRHGESEANIDPGVYRDKSHLEISLTQKGRDQINHTSQQIKQLFQKSFLELNQTISLITSPYLRTIQSAKLIAQNLPNVYIQKEALCVEQCWGDAEGNSSYQTYFESLTESEQYKEEDLLKRLGYMWYSAPRGETLMSVYTRAGLFVEKQKWFTESPITIISSHKVFLTMVHHYMMGTYPTEQEFEHLQGWGNADARFYLVSDSSPLRAYELL